MATLGWPKQGIWCPPFGGAPLEKYDIRDDNDMFRVAATVAQSFAVQDISANPRVDFSSTVVKKDAWFGTLYF